MLPTPEELIENLWRFSPHAYAAHISGGEWKLYRHLVHVGERIAMAVARGNGRIIVNMPPRLGKTEFMKYVGLWYLDTFPKRNLIVAGYGEELAIETGRWIRNEMSHNDWVTARLSEDSKAKGRWNTDDGGGLKAAGVGTGITGFGYDLGIIDDPYKDMQQAHSHAYQQQLREWWDAVFYNRAEPGGTIVVVHHRWHADDLTGWLLSRPEKWEHINLPHLAVANDPIDRAVGEALCPERYDEEAVERIRIGTGGSGIFDAMHQQDPKATRDGALYSHFNVGCVDSDIILDRTRPCCLTFDFNIAPGMHAHAFQYSSMVDMFTVTDEWHEYGMDLDRTMDLIVKWWKEAPFTEAHVYGDPSGKSRTIKSTVSYYQVIESRLKAEGIRVRMLQSVGTIPIIDRVTTVNDALRDARGRGHVKIHPRCERLLTDFREVKPDAMGGPLKSNQALTHASDDFGYGVFMLRPVGSGTRAERPRGRFSVTAVSGPRVTR